MFKTFIHVAACIGSSVFTRVVFHYISQFGNHFSCFQFLANMNEATVNILDKSVNICNIVLTVILFLHQYT